MRTLHVNVCGESLPVHFSRSTADLIRYLRTTGPVAIDTETTGLGHYAPGWDARLLILGNATSAFVAPLDEDAPRPMYGDIIRGHVETTGPVTFHNATYDRLALDRSGVLRSDLLAPEDWHDTRTLAHLLDPRMRAEGGQGLSLKELADRLIDPEASGEGQAVLKAVFKENGWTKDTGWRHIPTEHPDYIRYAGLDAILTARLLPILMKRVEDRDLVTLYHFERQVADLCLRMEKRGILADADYVETSLLPWLEQREEEGLKEAKEWGVENVNSTAQVAAALSGLGWEPQEFTPTGQPEQHYTLDRSSIPSDAFGVEDMGVTDMGGRTWAYKRGGKPKVDKAVLDILTEAGNPIAAAVQKAKRAGKWMVTYALPLLEQTDENGRIHPKINALQARTARMSVAAPPLQQLPSDDWRIRRALVADPGQVMWAADYDQVEMRVLAAMADEPAMKAAIADGVDLHDFTAQMVFGDDFTKAHRKLSKGVGFGKVYGGGAATISRQTGADITAVKRAIAGYDQAFPGIRRFQKRLESRAYVGAREVITASGRPLPLDGDRLYAATNYAVQSTSRDVLAQAMLRLEEAGVHAGETLLLPIHDEILGQSPEADFAEVAEIVKGAMTMDFFGVRLDAAAELYGASWGHGYGADS